MAPGVAEGNAGDAQRIAQTAMAPASSYSPRPLIWSMDPEPVTLFDPLPPLEFPQPALHPNTVAPDDPDKIKPGSGFHW
jgi:hypothetical protein